MYTPDRGSAVCKTILKVSRTQVSTQTITILFAMARSSEWGATLSQYTSIYGELLYKNSIKKPQQVIVTNTAALLYGNMLSVLVLILINFKSHHFKGQLEPN